MADRRIPFGRATLLRAALALGPLSGGAVAGVIVVDVSGAGDFTDLLTAVQEAADGDTLLIKGPGPYSNFSIDGKSLVVVGDPGPAVVGPIRVAHLAVGQRVVLRNLATQPGSTGYVVPGIDLLDDAGTVWIESCDLEGGGGLSVHHQCDPGGNDLPGTPGLTAVGCDPVIVVRSQLTGGAGAHWAVTEPFYSFHTPGGPAALIQGSSVAFSECTLQAGPGGTGSALCGPPGIGGDACVLTATEALLSGCTLLGGPPGDGIGAVGGDGLSLDATSSVQRLDSSITPGAGGVDLVTEGGIVDDFVGAARSFALTSPLRESQSGTLAIQGVQGDFVGFYWSFNGGSLPMPARNGWFVLNPSFLAGPFLLGAITDPGGTWILNVTGPNLPPASEAMTFLLQAYFAYPGGVTLGSGTAFTLVNSAF